MCKNSNWAKNWARCCLYLICSWYCSLSPSALDLIHYWIPNQTSIAMRCLFRWVSSYELGSELREEKKVTMGDGGQYRCRSVCQHNFYLTTFQESTIYRLLKYSDIKKLETSINILVKNRYCVWCELSTNRYFFLSPSIVWIHRTEESTVCTIVT